MIRSRSRVVLALLAAGALTLAGPRGARAFDSAGPDIKPQTHAQPTPTAPWPFGAPYFQASPDYPNDAFIVLDSTGGPPPYSTLVAKANGAFNFQVKMLHDVLGADSAYGGDPDLDVTSGVLQCPWPTDPTQLGFGDLSKCTPWSPSATQSMPGWAKVHRAWNTRASGADQNTASPEHMDIATASAAAAGLGSLALFNSTLWVRYPVNGTWLSSPIATAGSVPSTEWVTAPSWSPVDFGSMGSLATRGFRLAELAQLPDVANSVWDWAGGDETCPLDGLDSVVTNSDGTQTTTSAFGSTAKDLNACHDFSRVMGATNASHFMPLASGYYHYYHALALDRMAQCLDMSQKLAPVYATQVDDPAWPAYHSPNDSEINICEQEAFAYEMNAQHYLQDAWSTGHMWSRWGYPELPPFPSDIPPLPSGSPANLAARRFVIAASVASYAGTLHGAKGVTGHLLPSLLQGNFIDDPLCGPSYDDPANPQNSSLLTRWTMTPDAGTFAGVGDLFYNPFTGANLSSNTLYSTQLEHLVACGARSLYDLYQSGPQSYGSATPGDVNGLDVTSATLQAGTSFDTFCFGQSITNASMSGALGTFYLTRDWGQLFSPGSYIPFDPRDSIFSLVNELLVVQRGTQVTFTDPVEQFAFLGEAVRKINVDVQRLKGVLNARAILDPNGTASSSLAGAAPGTQLTMLGVPPNAAPPPTQALSSFVDVLSSQPTGTPQDSVRRMFWRAHPEDVCSVNLVNQLRARCIAGAQYEGDAEACTSCVDVAELMVPTCSWNQYNANPDAGTTVTAPTQIGLSKCSALDLAPQVGPVAGLPASWWDTSARVPTCGTFPSYWLAFSYCTGTDPLPIEGDTDYTYGRTVLQTQDLVASACNDPVTGQPPDLVSVQTRQAYAHRELSSIAQTARPIVIAWNQVDTEQEQTTGSGSTLACNDWFTSDQDDRISRLVPFPLWQSQVNNQYFIVSEDTLAELAPYNLPLCGTTQRLTVWNRNCSDVLNSFGDLLDLPPPPIPISSNLDPTTGIELLSVSTGTGPYAGEERCSMREARTFSVSCPGGSVCNTSGLCVPGRDSTGMPNGSVPSLPVPIVLP